MRYFTIVMASLLLASCQDNIKERLKPSHDKTDWAFYKLNGDVQQITIVSEKVDGTTPVYGTEYSTDTNLSLSFNEYGDLISENKMAGNTLLEENVFEGRRTLLSKKQYTSGKIAIITDNQWDAAKENILATVKHNPDNTQIEQVKNTYIKGKLAETVTLNNQGNMIKRNTYKYNKKGNLVNEEIYPDGHVLKIRVKYDYDSENRKVSETRYSTEALVYKTVFSYQNKLLQSKITTDSKGTNVYTEEFQYDEKGRVTGHKTVEVPLSIVTIEAFTYDDAGNNLTWSTNVTGESAVNVINAYDANNNLTATKTMSNNTIAESRNYTYTYDSHKNWTKKTVSVNGKVTYKVTRNITYFPEEDSK